MILQSLAAYSDRLLEEGIVQPIGLQQKEILWIVELDIDGGFVRLRSTGDGKRGRRFSMGQEPVEDLQGPVSFLGGRGEGKLVGGIGTLVLDQRTDIFRSHVASGADVLDNIFHVPLQARQVAPSPFDQELDGGPVDRFAPPLEISGYPPDQIEGAEGLALNDQEPFSPCFGELPPDGEGQRGHLGGMIEVFLDLINMVMHEVSLVHQDDQFPATEEGGGEEFLLQPGPGDVGGGEPDRLAGPFRISLTKKLDPPLPKEGLIPPEEENRGFWQSRGRCEFCKFHGKGKYKWAGPERKGKWGGIARTQTP